MKIEPEEKTKPRAKRTVALPIRKFRMLLRAKYIEEKPVDEVTRNCVTVKDKL